MKPAYLFLGGAAIGAIAALLLAPESGEDLRARLRSILQKKLDSATTSEDELAMIMEKISADLDDDKEIKE
ncbi:MAG: YtxH domain-containing protein [Bacteroidales bacterium]|nr:YtxH domain-containing protein [Bacteroidales bacterium]MDY2917996.1 YtxH domain-containing protein [Muribaculaceae bacterium]